MAYAMARYQGGEVQAAAIGAELYSRFLMYAETKPQTVETYRRALKPFFSYLAAEGITKPERADLLAYRESLFARVAAATVRLYIAAVRRFFAWTEQEGIYRDIARGLKGAQVSDEPKKDYLAVHQVEEVFEAVDRDGLIGKRDYAILRLMATTGLRTIEITRANIEDLTQKNEATVLYLQGKGRDERAEYVKIGRHTEEAIREYLKARPATEGKEPLFTSISDRNNGGRLTTKSISRIAKDSLRAAGMDSKRLTAHSFRHTAGTQALKNGYSLGQVQKVLRHKDPRTTEGYVHILDREGNNMEITLDGLYAY